MADLKSRFKCADRERRDYGKTKRDRYEYPA